MLFYCQDGERLADLRAHGEGRAVAATKRFQGGSGGGELIRSGAALRQEQPTPGPGKGRGVLDEFAELGDGPGGDKRGGIAQGAAGGILGAGSDDRNVRQFELGRHGLKQAGAFLEWFDQCDHHVGRGDGEDHAGVATAASHIDGRAQRGNNGPRDAEEFEAFRVLTADGLGGRDGGHASMPGRGIDKRRMALQEREPGHGITKAGEEARQVIPGEIHWTSRGAFTRSMVQWSNDE